MPIKRAAANDPRRCANCMYFYQHYYIPKFRPEEYRPANCGHCYAVRRRCVKPGYVCEHFKSQET